MYDNICKYLAERFPEDLASWLLGERIALTQMNPTELNVEPIRADSMILLRTANLILHLEFQTRPDSDIPFRMADYRLRAYRKFPTRQMRQIVIYLTPTTSELVYQTSFEIANTRHEFEVIRLWEQPAGMFLESPGLYPFASLGQTDEPESVLRSVAAKIEEVPERNVRANLAATTSILAGLVLDKEQIQRILRSDMMRESVMYQEFLSEAESRERQLVFRQLTRKIGNLSPILQGQVNGLPIDRIESLGEALLDFTSMSDLESWLSQN